MSDFLHFFNANAGIKISSVSNNGNNLSYKTFKTESLIQASGLNPVYDNRFPAKSGAIGSTGLTGSIGLTGPSGAMSPAIGNIYMYPVTNGTYTLVPYNILTFTANSIKGLKLESGTCVITVLNNGVPVTGFNQVPVTTSVQSLTSTANNVINTGNRVTLSITSGVSALGLEYSLGGTY